MIDYDDASDWALFGPLSILGLIILLILIYLAHQNDIDCNKKSCPNEKKATLMSGKCLCIEEAK